MIFFFYFGMYVDWALNWFLLFKILSKQVSGEEQSEETKYEDAMVTREFKSRSDEVMKKLVDWLAKYQTVENPLKFSQFEYDE